MPSSIAYYADVPKNKPLKLVLGENVTKVMKAKKLSQSNVAALAKQKASKIDQTTVGRIAKATMPTTVDTLDPLAVALGYEPWQLLVPDFDPANPPKLGAEGLTNDERELLDKYRGATGRWKISVRYMAGLRTDTEQEEVAEGVNVLLAKILGEKAYPVEKMSEAGWTRPDRLHESKASYKKEKEKK